MEKEILVYSLRFQPALKFFGRFRPLLVMGGLIIIWEIIARSRIFPPVILPSFSEVIIDLYTRLVSGDLMIAIWWSCARVFAGFFIGLALGYPIGLFIGWSRIIEDLINPIVETLRPIPPLAWIPLSVIWLGVGIKSVIFITTMGSFFPIVVSVIHGVQSVDKKVLEYSKTLGASTGEILRKVVLPLSLPPAFVGMRIAIGFCWMCVVAAEMISVKYGLGWMIWKARYSFQTESVIGGMAAIGFLSLFMTKGMLILEDVLFKWRKGVVRG